MERFKPIIFYIIFFLFILTYTAFANGYDYDLWAKLILGMAFFQTGQVLKQDFVSYTPTHTWYDHEWGSGVIFYITQHFFSTAGLYILQATLVFLIFFTITKIIKLRGVKTTSAYNFLFYFFAFSAIGTNLNETVRCQLFSFLLFAVFIYILEKARQGKNKALWLMPIIMIFWNNVHGGCIAGIGLIVLYIIGEFLNRAPIKKYILALIPTVLVLVINPWGIEYLSFLISAITMERPEIMEWWGLFSPYYLYRLITFKVLIFVMLFTEAIVVAKSIDSKTFSLKKLDKTKFLVLAATLYIATQHIKMIPFFAISACCFIYDDFYILLNSLGAKIGQVFKIKQSFVNALLLAKEITVYLVIIFFIIFNLKPSSFAPLVKAEKYPLREVEFVKINNIKGNLLINFGLGSYASYKLYPNNLIYMDGRYEAVYYDDLIPLLRDFALVKPGWDNILKIYPPEIIIIEKFYPIFTHLQTLPEWKLVYAGDGFGVFVKAKDAKKTYKQPPNEIEYYKQTVFDTNISFKNRLN